MSKEKDEKDKRKRKKTGIKKNGKLRKKGRTIFGSSKLDREYQNLVKNF